MIATSDSSLGSNRSESQPDIQSITTIDDQLPAPSIDGQSLDNQPPSILLNNQPPASSNSHADENISLSSSRYRRYRRTRCVNLRISFSLNINYDHRSNAGHYSHTCSASHPTAFEINDNNQLNTPPIIPGNASNAFNPSLFSKLDRFFRVFVSILLRHRYSVWAVPVVPVLVLRSRRLKRRWY